MEKLNNKNIFLIIDETEINSIKYCNTLAGDICLPHQTWLVDSRSIDGSINSTVVVNVIQGVLEYLNIQPDKFRIIMSNSATYMIKAGKMFKKTPYSVPCVLSSSSFT